MASGMVETPPCCNFDYEKYQQSQCIWLLTILLKFYRLTFKKLFTALAAPGNCHVASSCLGGNKLLILEVFRAYLREFSIFLHAIFFACSILSYLILSKSVVRNALVTLKTRLKVPILAIFDDFWHFLSSNSFN